MFNVFSSCAKARFALFQVIYEAKSKHNKVFTSIKSILFIFVNNDLKSRLFVFLSMSLAVVNDSKNDSEGTKQFFRTFTKFLVPGIFFPKMLLTLNNRQFRKNA